MAAGARGASFATSAVLRVSSDKDIVERGYPGKVVTTYPGAGLARAGQ
jgi:hypothetical protein